jgi:hypothetical protein
MGIALPHTSWTVILRTNWLPWEPSDMLSSVKAVVDRAQLWIHFLLMPKKIFNHFWIVSFKKTST